MLPRQVIFLRGAVMQLRQLLHYREESLTVIIEALTVSIKVLTVKNEVATQKHAQNT